MNEATTLGALNEALRRRYGVQGSPGPILTIASDLFPVISLQDASCDPELAFYMGMRLCTGGSADAADAGLASGVQIRNPTGSGVLCIIDRILVRSVTAQTCGIVFSNGNTPADTETPGSIRDIRLATAGNTFRAACQVGPRTIAAATPMVPFFVVNTVQELTIGLPLVLPPGFGLIFQGSTVNIQVAASFDWRERRLESWETVTVV